MSLSKIQKAGIVIIFATLVIGVVGTAVNIYISFDRLEHAEGAGIGPVANAIRNALFFSAGGVVGPIIGAILLILGRSKR